MSMGSAWRVGLLPPIPKVSVGTKVRVSVSPLVMMSRRTRVLVQPIASYEYNIGKYEGIVAQCISLHPDLRHRPRRSQINIGSP